MTSLAVAQESIKRMAIHHRDGDWLGEPPNRLLARWQNCRLAIVDDRGGLYIADPQRGHYLADDKAIEFVAWLESEGVTIDDEDDATDGPDPVADVGKSSNVAGILRKLRQGAHLRYNGQGYDLVTSKGRHPIQEADFEALLDRRVIMSTVDHALYSVGGIWLAREGPSVSEGGAR